MRRLIKHTVATTNDVVYECNDGSEALASYMRHRPDWVLMDIKMPELDGISATRQIVSAFPRARVLVVSQYDDQEMRDDARKAGAVDYVLKDNLLAICRIISRA